MLGAAVKKHLAQRGLAVDMFRTLAEADEATYTIEYAVILLDLSLPDGHGLNFLRSIRKRSIQTPVIIATAQDKISERIEGLNAGADDYLIKPYDLDELLARIHAAIRRSHGNVKPDYVCGPVAIDLSQRLASVTGQPVRLTAREWAVLEILVSKSGKIVSRADLESSLYDFDSETESNSVEVFVSRIRKKLGKDFVKTERGLGYRIAATQ
ncbi:Transcriptional regulatory protein QseB [Falsiruegeria litorea R37]|uniref:Transcriptional regulatory protein QseB n=2 Tax=Falsiruegeria litorea TaxID=1280831 RepID=A0A1Y5RUF8_9RHOB|nr:Transcriptional regulatory protein QseB [Falsiruegeria litorea R37]